MSRGLKKMGAEKACPVILGPVTWVHLSRNADPSATAAQTEELKKQYLQALLPIYKVRWDAVSFAAGCTLRVSYMDTVSLVQGKFSSLFLVLSWEGKLEPKYIEVSHTEMTPSPHEPFSRDD